MINTEYLIILVPVFLAILIIFYFIYHLWHTEKYSRKVLAVIRKKIDEIEEKEIEINGKIKNLIHSFKAIAERKRMHLFDIEREIGIDMVSFSNKLDKEIKKKKSN